MARKPKSHRSSSDIDFDKHVGQRIRERRKDLGLNQTKLADGLGISFRQLREYEKGSGRIGAGRLYGCAQLLNVSPAYFFEGLEGSDSGTPDVIKSDEVLKLVRAYYRINDPTERSLVRSLVKAIARSDI